MKPNFSECRTWEQALKKVKEARITMVIGMSDTGKTTLIKSFAAEIDNAGHTCGIIDADMGQSEIGPPTTIGLGRIYRTGENITHAEAISIYFVGSTSPRGYLLPTVVGTKKMVDKALAMGFDHILVDTTGLVRGPLGQALKGYKVELVEPDLIIFLQRQSECDPLIKRFQDTPKHHILVLIPSHHIGIKSPAQRKEYRERSLLAYFSKSRTKNLNLKGLYLLDFPLFSGLPVSEKERNLLSQKIDDTVLWAESFDDEFHVVTLNPIGHFGKEHLLRNVQKGLVFTYTQDEFEDILVGCYDKKGECYSLGIVRRISFFTQRAEVEVADDKEELKGIKFSRYKINQDGSGVFLPRKIPSKPVSLP